MKLILYLIAVILLFLATAVEASADESFRYQ